MSVVFAGLLYVGVLSYREDVQHEKNEQWVSHTYVASGPLVHFREAFADRRSLPEVSKIGNGNIGF
jgi:hypothetical protein